MTPPTPDSSPTPPPARGAGGPAPASKAAGSTKAPAPAGKAGRDLGKAIPVGVLLVAALVLSLVFDPVVFATLAVLAVWAGEWEMSRALAVRNIRVPLVPMWLGAAAMIAAAWMFGPSALMTAFLLTCGAVILWRALRFGGPDAMRDSLSGVFVTTYVPFLAAFAVLLAAMPNGAALVFTVLLIGVANDIGGYVAGVLFGERPMAPSISPKKSWEGFGGSVALAALVGALMTHFAVGGPWWVGLIMGVVGAFASTLGDFSESLIKRDLGIKDMSNLLPGHGGVLDRLDSLLICAPTSYAVLELFVLR